VESRAKRKTLVGKVISSKMEKGITVQLETKKKHPIYKKFVTYHKKIKARDEKNEAKEGDVVKLEETRPLSKEIKWRLVEIVEKAQRGQQS
jgi:small subunit ribosomal protein S17